MTIPVLVDSTVGVGRTDSVPEAEVRVATGVLVVVD